MSTTTSRPGIWSRSHYLDSMNLRELVSAFFQYHSVLVYLGLAIVSLGVAIARPATPLLITLSIGVGLMLVPLVWYGLHRFVLHGRWMWRYPSLAKTWKRIHYDHHQDPNHLEVLFGAVGNVLPVAVVTTLLPGLLIGGVGGAAAGFAAGLLMVTAYEFIHCIQHLGFKPKNKWLMMLKRRHMEHHFHDETGNFGIVSFGPDKLFGTLYERRERPTRSPTVFNLGYTAEVAREHPWVAELSGGVVSSHPRQRGQG